MPVSHLVIIIIITTTTTTISSSSGRLLSLFSPPSKSEWSAHHSHNTLRLECQAILQPPRTEPRLCLQPPPPPSLAQSSRSSLEPHHHQHKAQHSTYIIIIIIVSICTPQHQSHHLYHPAGARAHGQLEQGGGLPIRNISSTCRRPCPSSLTQAFPNGCSRRPSWQIPCIDPIWAHPNHEGQHPRSLLPPCPSSPTRLPLPRGRYSNVAVFQYGVASQTGQPCVGHPIQNNQ